MRKLRRANQHLTLRASKRVSKDDASHVYLYFKVREKFQGTRERVLEE